MNGRVAVLRAYGGEFELREYPVPDPEPGAILDYARRLGVEAPAFAAGSFPESGYHVWRSGRSALVVDAGPLGPDYLPAHAEVMGGE